MGGDQTCEWKVSIWQWLIFQSYISSLVLFKISIALCYNSFLDFHKCHKIQRNNLDGSDSWKFGKIERTNHITMRSWDRTVKFQTNLANGHSKRRWLNCFQLRHTSESILLWSHSNDISIYLQLQTLPGLKDPTTIVSSEQKILKFFRWL